jgi:hypothetical protein
MLVTSDAQWVQIWSELFACMTPPPAVPAIDFGREMVALAALGERSSSGYGAAIRSASVDASGTLHVLVTEYRPGRGCGSAAVITYPVAVARLPRREGPIQFEDEAVVFDCE